MRLKMKARENYMNDNDMKDLRFGHFLKKSSISRRNNLSALEQLARAFVLSSLGVLGIEAASKRVTSFERWRRKAFRDLERRRGEIQEALTGGGS